MENPFSKHGIFENKYIIGSFLLGTFLQTIVVVVVPVAKIFKLVPLTMQQWLYTIVISFIPIIIVELQKKFNDFKFGKIIYRKEESSI